MKTEYLFLKNPIKMKSIVSKYYCTSITEFLLNVALIYAFKMSHTLAHINKFKGAV